MVLQRNWEKHCEVCLQILKAYTSGGVVEKAASDLGWGVVGEFASLASGVGFVLFFPVGCQGTVVCFRHLAKKRC